MTRRLALLATALIGVTAIRLIGVDSPLAYDESVYALGGRELVSGESSSQFAVYRPIGMQVLSAAGVLLGGSTIGLRAVALVASLACVLAFWCCIRRLSLLGGVATLLALATSWQVQHNAAQLLSDLPSLAFVFLLVALVAHEMEREDGPSWRLAAAAPLAAAAFYLRYGTTMVLAAIVVAGTIVWWRRLAKAWWHVVATLGLFALLMTPHLVHSLLATGDLFGIMRAGRSVAGREYFGEGLVDLARNFPVQPAGPLIGLLMVIGFASGVVHLAQMRSRPDSKRRLVSFAFLAASVHMVAVGFDVHFEARYFFFGMMLLTALGVDAVVHVARARVTNANTRRLWGGLAPPRFCSSS